MNYLIAIVYLLVASAQADLYGIQGGLVVCIGTDAAEQVSTEWKTAGYMFQCLETSDANVSSLRKKIQSAECYGKVSAIKFDGTILPYADNMINLLVISTATNLQQSEINRALAPNGIALVNGKKVTKPWPADLDEWTHWLHGPDGNPVARDRNVGPPRQLQWIAKPYWARLHDAPSSTSAMVTSAGRIFYIGDEGVAGTYDKLEDKWFLIARDAFNGTLLWKRPMPNWGWKAWAGSWHARNNQPFQLSKRLVSIGNTLYITMGFNAPVSAIDAATGKTIHTYEETEGTDEILYHNGQLILSINQTKFKPSTDQQDPLKKSIAVIDAANRTLHWKTGTYTGIRAKTNATEPLGRLEMAAGGNSIYFFDDQDIIGLDLKTGTERWRTPRQFGPKLPANFDTRMYELSILVYNEGVVLIAQPEGTTSFHSVPGTLYAYDAKDGTLLWKQRYGEWVHNTQPNLFVIDGTVWIHEHQEGEEIKKNKAIFSSDLHKTADYSILGLDLKTGKQQHRIPTRTILDTGHHHRCYRNKATERFLLMSRRGVEFINIQTGENDLNHWTRGDCQLGVMPANGLLYTTPHPCSCYINTKLNGYIALAPKNALKNKTTPIENPLIKGPAFGQVDASKSANSPMDWVTFRGDAQRRGLSKSTVAANPSTLWKTKFNGEVGPVTVANGLVFVPIINKHRIVALDESTGKERWSFIAGARVDTPPTLHKGMALFGSTDGWAYCLRAQDGVLVWKRRMAPTHRFIGVLGQLESAWPVHGSILIKNETAYLSAGRSSYLDGGIYCFALNPETGEIIEQKTLYNPDPKTGKMAHNPKDTYTMPGALTDILVSSDDTIWMRKEPVFGTPTAKTIPLHATGGFRDASWFNRTTWAVGKAKHAQLLVADNSKAYCIESFASASRSKPFTPGAQGYRLSAISLDGTLSPEQQQTKEKTAAKKKSRKRTTAAAIWSHYIPIRSTAMAVADHQLILVGAPDIVDPDDPLGAFEGRKGAILSLFSTRDGKKISEQDLDTLPIWDGLAVAHGKLFLSMQDGTVRCFK